MSEKKALITGITGFIGFNLAKKLVENGWKVYGIVRESSDVSKIIKDENIILCTYNKEFNLNDIMKKVHPNVVYHLASLYLASHQYSDIDKIIDSNIGFGTKLLDSMVKNEIFNLVNTGTSWQNYNNEKYNPVNLYAASKQAFETMMRYYQETSSLKVINLKLFDTFGPDDTRRKIFALLNECVEKKKKLAMSPGAQLIDLVYIDDVVEAFLLAGEYMLNCDYDKCGTYAVSSACPLTLRELVKKYEMVSGKKVDIEWGGRDYREREVMIPWNNGKLLPGWNCKNSIETGINKFLLRMHR